MSSIRIRMATTFQLITLCHKEISEGSSHPTPIFLNLLFSVMNWDMLKLIQILYVYGRLNSAILPMEHKLSLINSFVQEKQNGTSKTELSCSYHMDMMVQALNILHQELSDSCSCVTKMKNYQRIQKLMIDKVSLKESIWKSVSLQLQQTISIF